MDDALTRTSDLSRTIVNGLFARINRHGRSRNDRIRRHVGRYWVALRSDAQDRVFAEIRPHRRHVEVFILPRPKDLRDPHRLARRAPKTQGWGWFRARFHVASVDRVPWAYELIRQSYEDGGRGNGPGSRGVRSRPQRL